MRTSKDFSTISYNTLKFLIAKLDDLVKRKKIDFYAFIEHLPEDDEKKNHFHIFMTPNGLLDTSQLKEEFDEMALDENGVIMDKPLSILPCKPSVFGDWYLYTLHDVDYLAKKNQVRIFHYKKEEFHTSSEEYFNELIHTIDFTKYKLANAIKDAVIDNTPFEELVARGNIPVTQINNARLYYHLILQSTYLQKKPKYEFMNKEQFDYYDNDEDE